MTKSQEFLSDLVSYTKYARFTGDHRESLTETVLRNAEMHIKKYPELEKEIYEVYAKFVLDRKVLPSMRAIEDSTPIYTKEGWKQVGGILEGDILFDSKGKETKVKAVQHFKNKLLYRIEFSDHTSLKACGEHLWIVSTRDSIKTRVVTTLWLKKYLRSGGGSTLKIWNHSPIDFPERSYIIDPYILGLWLGGGYATETQYSGVKDIPFFKEKFENFGYTFWKAGKRNTWACNVKGLKEQLEELNLVQNKHIPIEYLKGSVSQRLKLVQGLIDTAGHITTKGRVVFSNTNSLIIEGLEFILNSLGITYIKEVRKYFLSKADLWTLSFHTDLKVALLPRKAKKLKTTQNLGRKILSVLPIGKGDATCFHVDSEDSSFLVGKNMVITHNSMQFAGKPIELNPARMFNCAYLPIDDYRAFSEIMFLLLGGTGVGYSVQFRHVNKLPTIKVPHGKTRYLIQDSAIGWASAVQRLFKAYLLGAPFPEFDYGDIRPKGRLLITSGGRAPGPEPLEKSLTNVNRVLQSKEIGSKLKPINIFDIINYLCDAVLSGGIRRSATIALFDVSDDEMLYSKTGEWWTDNNQRARANISAVLDRRKLDRKTFDKIFDALEYSGSGEPGFFLTNDPDYGVNPCGEVALRSFGMCNLTSVNIGDNLSNSEFFDRCRAASFIGTLQAGYTDFHYLRPIWRERSVADALLGISLTGIASGSYRKLDLTHGAKLATAENERVADKIGIRPAKRVTTVKPEGTSSLVLGTSSGVHPYWARWQIRNIEVSTVEPLYAYLAAAAPEWIKPKRGEPGTALFRVPLENPEGGAYRTETALEALERIKLIQRNWINPGHLEGLNKHNVSATVSVKEDEWGQVREWLWENKDEYTGLTLFPYYSGTHTDAPNIEITEEEYKELEGQFPDLDLTNIKETEDLTNLAGELACSGATGCSVI